MVVKMSLSALKRMYWYQYAIRFGLGGVATVAAGLIGSRFGVSVGGLFLALPAIFCASATLVESHARHAKERAGLRGSERGRQAAALDAAGAGLGSLGLAAFALVFHLTIHFSTLGAFVAASLAWTVLSVSAWLLRRKLRIAHSAGGSPERHVS